MYRVYSPLCRTVRYFSGGESYCLQLGAAVVESVWMDCDFVFSVDATVLLSLLVRTEDGFAYCARSSSCEHRPVPLPVAGCVTTCDDFDGGVVDIVVGRSHRVAPRTTGLTCQPNPRAICKEEALRSRRGVVETGITNMTMADVISWFTW